MSRQRLTVTEGWLDCGRWRFGGGSFELRPAMSHDTTISPTLPGGCRVLMRGSSSPARLSDVSDTTNKLPEDRETTRKLGKHNELMNIENEDLIESAYRRELVLGIKSLSERFCFDLMKHYKISQIGALRMLSEPEHIELVALRCVSWPKEGFLLKIEDEVRDVLLWVRNASDADLLAAIEEGMR